MIEAQSQNIVYLSAELNRLCRMRVSTDISIRGLSPVGGLILPLYSVVAHRNAPSRVQSIYFRTSVKDPLTLLVNSKTYEKVVLHMTFEGAKSQGRSPVKPTRMALEIGRCCINQQSRVWAYIGNQPFPVK